MEAAAAILRELPARRRAAEFERECERLRPLGEAYVLRRFGGSLGRADAEDAVADVLIRLHRRMEEGRAPENLRAAFFTSARNAAIDLLRSRAAKPTAPLEVAADAPAQSAIPAERAESREDAVRLQEALRRMRGNYREAIVLRFGLGLTVPEIAAHLGISLPAAKKLLLRATRQVKQRLEAIEGAEFCPEMRDLARHSLLEKEASGLASEAEAAVLHTHFEHCGSCRSFLAELHGALHEVGSAALLGLTAADSLSGRLGVAERLTGLADVATDAAAAGAGRARHLAMKLTGVSGNADSATTGMLAGTGQKIAAVCGAGAATATCLLTGVAGPGIGISASAPQPEPPARVKTVASTPAEPQPVAPAPVPEPAPAPAPSPDPAPEPDRSPAPALNPAAEPTPPPPPTSPPSEFGIEGSSTSASDPAPSVRPAESGGDFGTGGSTGGAGGSAPSQGGGSLGFQG